MPTNGCQYFYDCRHCAALLKPLPGHCCVFCSCGSVKYPRRSRPEDVARDLMSPAPLQLIAALGGTREPQDPPQQAWLTRPSAVRLLT